MYIWIVILIAGIVLTAAGYFVFITKNQDYKQINKPAMLVGIFIPMFVAINYAETLFEFFPKLTLIDLGAFYLIGMISGFFTAVYFIQNKKIVIPGNKNSD